MYDIKNPTISDERVWTRLAGHTFKIFLGGSALPFGTDFLDVCTSKVFRHEPIQ